ncbi:uncharacterized protein [Porites lutea]|uniref:uncharacterized protein n=1 Tax=Porites lutea TaxID=51062 RepID=UPI003CC5861C
MIPRVQSQEKPIRIAVAALSSAMYSAHPQTFNLQKTLGFFRQSRNKEITEGGILKSAITNNTPSVSELARYSTPAPGFHILESHASYYVHLLFGLKDRNIGTIFSYLAVYTYRGFLELEKNWQRLVKDIEEGSLDSDLELDTKIRSELDRYLKPDKKRAEELRKEFQAGFDGIASRIWPNFRIIRGRTTGRQELYAKRLREKYTGDVPMYSSLYISSESIIGVNLWPKDEPMYLPVLSAAFFEFVPVENCHEEQAKTCLAEDLEVNSLYELVITTPGGLYRYRMGDVVRVARFHYKSPVLEFQYRRGTVLPCHMTEKMVYDALCESVESFKEIKLVDYTCAGSLIFDGISSETGTKKGPEQAPFHIVFVELSGFLTKEETCLLQEKLEEALCNYNSSYRDFRKNGEESPVFLYRVKQGTFDLLMQHFMEANPMTSPVQFKIPRLIKTKAAGKLLLENLHPQHEHMK